MTKKRILLNAFDMNCPSNQSPGLWSHPDNEAHRYTDINYWIEFAQLLEEAQFDSVFLADVLGPYDVYEGKRDAGLRQAVQSPINDPLLIVPAMAAVTKNLSFGITASVTHEHPYTFSRRMSTLDHLTKGRVGWNVVTSYLKSAALNMGLDEQIGHDDRYAIAEEYLDVCYKLWEKSWDEDAVVRDVERKMYVDPDKVHDIQHKGKYFTVPGAHLCEPSPQRTPVIFQAGLSPKEVRLLQNTRKVSMSPCLQLILHESLSIKYALRQHSMGEKVKTSKCIAFSLQLLVEHKKKQRQNMKITKNILALKAQ